MLYFFAVAGCLRRQPSTQHVRCIFRIFVQSRLLYYTKYEVQQYQVYTYDTIHIIHTAVLRIMQQHHITRGCGLFDSSAVHMNITAVTSLQLIVVFLSQTAIHASTISTSTKSRLYSLPAGRCPCTLCHTAVVSYIRQQQQRHVRRDTAKLAGFRRHSQ